MKRVLIAGLYHETHTFLQGLTRREDCQLKHGRELLDSPGEGSPLAGAVETARRLGWDLVPTIDLRAMPGPTVADEVVRTFWEAMQPALSTSLPQGLDGVFLVLHGAMVSESCDDVEGEILHRLRSALGNRPIPVGGVIDLHANFTRKMAENADALVAYRENPHVDAKASAERAAELLDRLMQTGRRPTTLWRHPPILWPPTGTATNSDPMRALEDEARRIERRHSDILAVNVLAGFAFADVPDAGVSFTAVTQGDPETAESELARLAALADELKELGSVREMPASEALQRVADTFRRPESVSGGADIPVCRKTCNTTGRQECLPHPGEEHGLAAHRKGPVILVEPSDNIGGGAPGDGTGLLRALLDYNVEKAVAVINDPEAVATLAAAPIGSRTQLSIGGKGSPLDAGPLLLDVELISRSDGRFTLEDPHSHLASMAGTHIDMGPSAVVRCRGVLLLLTSRKTPPFDLGQLRSQGILPEQQRVIVVKAAVAHRAAYDPIAASMYWVDTPGPCSSNLRSLPYRKVRRPIFPLD
jgi:microcystin degradation protein MlrC